MSWDNMLQASRQFEALFISGDLADVTLVVGSAEILAHKAFLAARSPVFAAMFKNECIEKRDGRVVIEDIDEEVLRVMIGYMYSCKVPDEKLAKLAESLYVAADKYALEDLKSLCTEHLLTQITVDSAAHLYLFADMYNVIQLKTQCIEYINTNCIAVRATDGWKVLLYKRPQLLEELYADFTDKSEYRGKYYPPPASSAPIEDWGLDSYSHNWQENNWQDKKKEKTSGPVRPYRRFYN